MKKQIRFKLVSYALLLATIFFTSSSSAATPVVEWTKPLVASSADIAADALGNVFVTGTANGPLFGSFPPEANSFVAKYDSAGNQVWGAQFGTTGSDYPTSLALDGSGNMYMGGVRNNSADGFLARVNLTGSQTLDISIATSSFESLRDVHVSANGNYYAVGDTNGNLYHTSFGSSDGFIYSNAFQKQVGTSQVDQLFGVNSDSSGNVFVAGQTRGVLGSENFGVEDAFVSKYSSSGNLLWTKQFGTSSMDYARDILVDSHGDVIVFGSTDGNLFSSTPGSRDLFVSKFSNEGTFLWGKQYAIPGAIQYSSHATIDQNDNIYVSSISLLAGINYEVLVQKIQASGDLDWSLNLAPTTTVGTVGITHGIDGTYVGYNGFRDVNGNFSYLVKIVEVPEPGSAAMYAFAMVTMLGLTKRFRTLKRLKRA